MLANSLVYINSTPTVKVRVLNPFQNAVHLRQDTIIGTAEEISSDDILQTVLNCENPDDSENFSTVRRIKLDNNAQKHQAMSFSRNVRDKPLSAENNDLHYTTSFGRVI